MARQILILAQNHSEANRYAKRVGLPRFTYRAVRSAGAIRGVRDAEVHILPGFAKRPDRHSINAALRHARSLTIVRIEDEDPRGPLDDLTLEHAYASHALREHARVNGEVVHKIAQHREPVDRVTLMQQMADDLDEEPSAPTPAPEPSQDAAPATPPAPTAPRARRTRCATCGELYLAADPAESKEHEHLAPVVKLQGRVPISEFF